MKSCRFLSLVVCLVCLAYCCAAALGQSPNAALTGFVDDPSKAAIPKVSITAINTLTGVKSSTTSNSSGQYVLQGLIPGSYRIEVDKQGFKGIIEAGVVLHVQDIVQMNFHMAVGSMSETVTVDGSNLQINTTDASVSTVIDRQFVENIPLNGRSFQSLEALAPGVLQVPLNEGNNQRYGGEFTVNGQRAESNYFTVDGVSANTGVGTAVSGGGAGISGSLPGESALGSTQSLVSIDALQEFRATTSTFSAEYGRAPGGQFSFVTRSGTDRFHGLLFDYFRNDVFDASNWFNGYTNNPPLRKAAERQNDFGGTFGGPLRLPLLSSSQHPTFFFVSYEGMRLDAPQTAVQQNYPNSSLRANAPSVLQPVLNSFPIANGPDLGNGIASFNSSYSNPANLDSFSTRFDHTFNDRLNTFVRYSHAPSQTGIHSTQNLADITYNSNALDTVTAGFTGMVSHRLSNEFRFNYTENNSASTDVSTSFGGAQPLNNAPGNTSIQVGFTYVTPSPSTFIGKRIANQSQINIVDNVSVNLGKHVFKYGIDYKRLSTQISPYSLSQELIFESEASVLTGNIDISILDTSPIKTKPTYTNFSAFAQDEWKLSPKLSLSAGVRWDLTPPPGDAYGNIPYTLNQTNDLATASLAAKGTALWKTRYANFAPRVGVAYIINPRSGWNSVLRAGAGIFYDPGNALASLGVTGIGYSQYSYLFGAPYPLTDAQTDLPLPSIAPPYSGIIYANDPHLHSPYSTEWNMTLEQDLGKDQSLTLGWVGSTGRKMWIARCFVPVKS